MAIDRNSDTESEKPPKGANTDNTLTEGTNATSPNSIKPNNLSNDWQ